MCITKNGNENQVIIKENIIHINAKTFAIVKSQSNIFFLTIYW